MSAPHGAADGPRTRSRPSSRRRSPCSTRVASRALTFRALAARLGGGRREHLLVRLEQGRAARPSRRPRPRRRARRRRGRRGRRSRRRPPDHRPGPLRRDRRAALARRLLHAQHGASSRTPCASTSVSANRCSASTSLRAQSFHAVSAVVGFVVGTAADMGQQPPEAVLSGAVGPRRVPRPLRRPVARPRPGRRSRSSTSSSTSSRATTTPSSSGPDSTSSSPGCACRPPDLTRSAPKRAR